MLLCFRQKVILNVPVPVPGTKTLKLRLELRELYLSKHPTQGLSLLFVGQNMSFSQQIFLFKSTENMSPAGFEARWLRYLIPPPLHQTKLQRVEGIMIMV